MKRIILLLWFCATSLLAQQTDYVDFKTAKAEVSLNPSVGLVYGEINYTFEVLKSIDSIYFDTKDYFHVVGFFENENYFGQNGKHLVIKKRFLEGNTYEIKIGFSSYSKKAIYFIDWKHHEGKKQIWTQGQGKYTSNWLPSIDDMNEKIEFDLSITFDKDYQVIANGNLTDKQINDSTVTWHYDMKKPMSSYLVALTIGKYNKKVEYSKSGIPLEMYYYPEDSLKFEPTYRYTKQMFDFLEEEIGVPYPWQNYKMVPVKDFLYAGMENTSLNIYSDAFVVDSIAFVDKNFVNINAHELAHQWFGDLVTETSGTHHWLQEGFATYYALLAEKEIFGEDYYYWRLYEYAQELKAQDETGQSTSLLDPKSSSTTFYKKGAWVLHILREKIGDEAFREGVKNYLKKHQFKNVETDDFISEVEKSSGEDLNELAKKWLESPKLPYDEMEEFFYLTSIKYKGFLQLDCKKRSSDCNEYILNTSNDDFVKAQVVNYLENGINKDVLIKSGILVRQAIAQNLSDIPSELKEDYESLLNDTSYITIETALFNLWKNFPEDRTKYLNQTKNIVGFNDKNVRMLWLTLALITDDYKPENNSKYFQELTNYTSPDYGFEVRQNAFQYLTQIQACNADCKANLKQATTHHNWRFKKFAKSLLEQE